jgi:capsular polysaccharide export protein
MTLEPFACSTLSHFTSDAQTLQDFAADKEPIPQTILYPKIASHSILHEIRFTIANLALKWKYRAYQTHRSIPAYRTYSGWFFTQIANFWKRKIKGETISQICPDLSQDSYIFALQSEGDFQLRAHSPFPSRFEAMDYVLGSFAKYAPKNAILVIKPHPLETLQKELYKQLNELSQTHALSERIQIVEAVPIGLLCKKAKGFVTINSSAGFEAIGAECPTCSVMPALYDMEGLTYQGSLDNFWHNTEKPDLNLFEAMQKALANSIQVRGTLYNHEGRKAAAKECADKLMSLAHFTTPVIEQTPPRLEKAARMGVYY